MNQFTKSIAQFFCEIEKSNCFIENMFIFIEDIRWITLMYNDDMDHNMTDTLIKSDIFETYTIILKKMHRILWNAKILNNCNCYFYRNRKV